MLQNTVLLANFRDMVYNEDKAKYMNHKRRIPMKDILANIRKPETITNKPASIACLGGFLLLGIVLGAFSKWLDNLALDSTIWWHTILEKLDLGNVFSEFPVWLLLALCIALFSKTPVKAAVNTFLFFAGMCVIYHIYTVFFSGFNPMQYMMIWYGITLVSPLLAVVCWYGKGEHIVSIVIDTLIVAVFTMFCFSIGWIYFAFNGILNALIFLAAGIVLYKNPKQIAIAELAGVVLAFLLRPLLPIG